MGWGVSGRGRFLMAYFMRRFRVRRRAAVVFLGNAITSANHLLTYEKEFATDKDCFVPKPWVSGHPADLLSGRPAQAAGTGLLGSPVCICLSAVNIGHSAGAGCLV